MTKVGAKKRPFAGCIPYSILVHLVGLLAMGHPGMFEFTAPVAVRSAVVVDLVQSSDVTNRQEQRKRSVPERVGPVAPNGDVPLAARADRPQVGSKGPVLPARSAPGFEPEAQAHVTGPMPAQEKVQPPQNPAVTPLQTGSITPTQVVKLRLKPPLRSGSEFIAAARERLTYRIVMFGIHVGEAVLEAVNNPSLFTITTRVRSNAAVEHLYPVDDLIETQLICGNYLVTKISQHEGNYSRNAGFTLMLREGRGFSVERLKGGFATDPLPRQDVLDIISGFYFLRNQPLHVGRPVLQHLYNGNTYLPTPIEVLRTEIIHIAGLGEVETLVIHPLIGNAALFVTSGETLIWLTADRLRVPVRIRTTIPIGNVTAELVSSEVE